MPGKRETGRRDEASCRAAAAASGGLATGKQLWLFCRRTAHSMLCALDMLLGQHGEALPQSREPKAQLGNAV